MGEWWEKVFGRGDNHREADNSDDATKQEIKDLRRKHEGSLARSNRLILELEREYRQLDEQLRRK